jgi:hypothetical protein
MAKLALASYGSIGNKIVAESSVRCVTLGAGVRPAQKTRPLTQYDVNDLASPGY